MGLLGAAAVAAGMESRALEFPVGAPLAASRTGVPALGYRHEINLRIRVGRPSARAPARALVEIRPTAWTESCAVLPTAWGQGKLEKQGLAHFRPQVQPPPIVKLHVAVALEIRFLVATTSCARPLGEDLERYIHGLGEPDEAADALELGRGLKLAPHRDLVTVPVDHQLAPDRLPPLCGRQIEVGRPGLDDNPARPFGERRQVKDESGHMS